MTACTRRTGGKTAESSVTTALSAQPVGQADRYFLHARNIGVSVNESKRNKVHEACEALNRDLDGRHRSHCGGDNGHFPVSRRHTGVWGASCADIPEDGLATKWSGIPGSFERSSGSKTGGWDEHHGRCLASDGCQSPGTRKQLDEFPDRADPDQEVDDHHVDNHARPAPFCR